MGEVWTQWEGQVVGGKYPLRRFLNASDHSAVFLTEAPVEGFFNAAVKLVPVEPGLAELQLWHWKTAATFSHPHLMRLLESGQCEIEGRSLLFVVMEYAEENLSQVLPYRGLGGDEIRELLVPTLDALAFLHRENWVQGQLKPANFLVVNDQLKLATDTIRPVGVAREKVTRTSIYDPPEIEQGEISAAGDVWGLGVAVVEALTQYPPTWPKGRLAPPSFPASLPAPFVDLVQRCLSVNPAERPTVADLQLRTKPGAAPEPLPTPNAARETAAPVDDVPAAVPVTATAPRESVVQRTASAEEPPIRAEMRSGPDSHSPYPPQERRSFIAPLVAVLVVIAAALGGWRLFRGHPGTTVTQTSLQDAASGQSGTGSPELTHDASQRDAEPAHSAGESSRSDAPSGQSDVSRSPASRSRSSMPAVAAESPSEQTALARTGPRSLDNSAVVHEEVPRIPQSARQTIHGRIKVAVRVTVDGSGKVVRDKFENSSSSHYFNRVASEAARKWRFASAEGESSREWLLHFEFGRDGATVRATRTRS